MYEHLRGGLRNQIPKFNIGSTITQLGNLYITLGAGLQMPFNPLPTSTNSLSLFNLIDYILLDLKRLLLEYEAKLFSTPASGDLGGGEKDSKFKLFLNKGVSSATNYLVQNAGQFANMGMNAALAWATSGVEQGGFMNSVNGASNFIRNIPGVGEETSLLLGTITTGLNVINKLGGTYVDKYQANKDVVSKMGGSYGGWVDLAQRAQDATGKTYGFLSGGAGKARALGRNAWNLENKIASINNTYQDQVAMAMNDANYTRYLFNLNGGLNPTLMRSSKFGSKLERIRRITSKLSEEPIEEFAEDLWEPQLFKEGGTIEENIEEDVFLEDSWEPLLFLGGGKTKYSDLAKEYYSDYDLSNINIIEDKQPRAEGNNIYVSSDEDVIHELWHVLSNNKPNELYKLFYDSLNDNRIIELGGDLDFVKRTGDPNVFYHPSEIEARIKAAKYKTKGLDYTKDFFKELRSNENKFGYNMRDLLHMYNDENLEKIFNLKTGGNLPEQSSEQEETNQKNIIPEGALHKEKHHMENSDDLTKKGIPVIDNDGVLLAEIERDEIVFTLEVTKKLEDLYHKYYDLETSKKDDLAIEAGKILVYEILYNTIDKTGLISKCKEGGKLNET